MKALAYLESPSSGSNAPKWAVSFMGRRLTPTTRLSLGSLRWWAAKPKYTFFEKPMMPALKSTWLTLPPRGWSCVS